MIEKNNLELIEELKNKVFEDKEILSVERLGGLTNFTYHVTLDCGDYIFRLPGKGTEELINRHDEEVSNKLASELGIDSPIIYFNANTGVKICEYVSEAETMSPTKMQDKENIALAGNLLRKLHSCGKDTEVPFNVFDMINHYEKIILENNGSFYDDYQENKDFIFFLKDKIDFNNIAVAPCHNDPLCENWVKSNDTMYLVDWEYAGMNDPMWDLADVSIEASYSKNEDSQLLEAYFGGKPTEMERLRFEANKIFLDFLWSLWGKTRVPFDGDDLEVYAYDRYQRMKKNIKDVKEII